MKRNTNVGSASLTGLNKELKALKERQTALENELATVEFQIERVLTAIDEATEEE